MQAAESYSSVNRSRVVSSHYHPRPPSTGFVLRSSEATPVLVPRFFDSDRRGCSAMRRSRSNRW